MNLALENMLARYDCSTRQAHENALREILQEISLLGLWRAKFFERAAFYGGSALRIHYGLDRFSEDLDFSLLEPAEHTDFTHYFDAIRSEITGFGFAATVSEKLGSRRSNITAGMVRLGLRESLLEIEVPPALASTVPSKKLIKIRIEIDTQPPPGFETESRSLLQPIPFYVRTYRLPYLFASKVHAVLCRKWKSRVKGRDWYDLVWYVGRGTKLSLSHLQQRMIDSGDWPTTGVLGPEEFVAMTRVAINALNIEIARRDVLPFLVHPEATAVWSTEFFGEILERIEFL